MDEARKYAILVMDIFGFEDCIADNFLESEDRQLFYMLQSEGMLTTNREDALLHDGRRWRLHYWRLNKNAISRYANGNRVIGKNKIVQDFDDNIYSYLSDDMWASRKKPAI